MRNEGDQMLAAIEEALRIGKAANTPVHIVSPHANLALLLQRQSFSQRRRLMT